MKFSDIPQSAQFAPATPIPTKVVPDWDALRKVLEQQGFVIIESDEVRTATSAGAEECVPVKAFASHVRATKKLRLRVKRIGITRWFCTI
jgi:hypothetical protein